MLIKELILKNFQAHKDAHFLFSRYLTVIKGTSGVGKSAILRAIFQLIDENIPWSVCHTWDTDETRIKLIGNTGTIERIKTTKGAKTQKNVVVINNKEYEYVGKDAPGILETSLNIRDYNIQKQKNPWFLIDMKPSALSKELNSVSSLNIIDFALKETAQRVRNQQAEIRVLTAQSASIEEHKLRLAPVVEAREAILKLVDLEKEIDAVYAESAVFSKLQERLQLLQKEKERILPAKAHAEFNSILEIWTEFKALRDKTDRIQEIKRQIDQFKDIYNWVPLCVSFYNKLVDIKNEISLHAEQLKILASLLRDMQKYTDEYKAVCGDIKDYEKELGDIPVCPTCKRPFDSKYGAL